MPKIVTPSNPEHVRRVRALIEAGRLPELVARTQLTRATLRAFALGSGVIPMTAVVIEEALAVFDEDNGRAHG